MLILCFSSKPPTAFFYQAADPLSSCSLQQLVGEAMHSSLRTHSSAHNSGPALSCRTPEPSPTQSCQSPQQHHPHHHHHHHPTTSLHKVEEFHPYHWASRPLLYSQGVESQVFICSTSLGVLRRHNSFIFASPHRPVKLHPKPALDTAPASPVDGSTRTEEHILLSGNLNIYWSDTIDWTLKHWSQIKKKSVLLHYKDSIWNSVYTAKGWTVLPLRKMMKWLKKYSLSWLCKTFLKYPNFYCIIWCLCITVYIFYKCVVSYKQVLCIF